MKKFYANKFKTHSVFLGLLCLLLFTINIASAQVEYVVRNDARRLSKSTYTLTEDKLLRGGAIWNPNKIDLTKSFELTFLIYLGDKDGGGGEGIAFVIHNDPRGFDAKGEVGGGFYFGDSPTAPIKNRGLNRPGIDDKIIPSVAIKFDTWQNIETPLSEPWYDHTTVVYNGDIASPRFAPVAISSTNMNVEDNNCHLVSISWDPTTKTLKLFFDGIIRFSHTDDIIQVLGGVPVVYFGFTGCTGGSINEQTISFPAENTIPTNKNDSATIASGDSTDVNVQANDKDMDEDPIFTTEIITPPKNGSALILIKDKIRYKSNQGYIGRDSLQYRICDIDPWKPEICYYDCQGPERCYANCTNAWVYFNVTCPDYTLIATKLKDNTVCTAPFSGHLQSKFSDGSNFYTDGFQFNWYRGNLTLTEALAKTPIYTGFDNQGLEAGNYTVVGSSINSMSCSQIQHISIENNPQILVATIHKTPATLCNPHNGKLKIEIANPENYRFQWYEGPPTNWIPISTAQELINLTPGLYTCMVEQLSSSCLKDFTSEIELVSTPHISPEVSGHTYCSPQNISLIARGSAHSYQWYSDSTSVKAIHTGDTLSQYFSANTSFFISSVNASGCESLERTKVDVVIQSALKVEITQIDSMLSGSVGNYKYQWYFNDSLLIDSIQQITPKKTGYYKLKIVDKNNCDNTSESIFYTVTGLDEERLAKNLNLYPNPTNGELKIEIPFSFINSRLTIIDAFGRQVYKTEVGKYEDDIIVLDVSYLPKGLYQVMINKGSLRLNKVVLKN